MVRLSNFLPLIAVLSGFSCHPFKGSSGQISDVVAPPPAGGVGQENAPFTDAMFQGLVDAFTDVLARPGGQAPAREVITADLQGLRQNLYLSEHVNPEPAYARLRDAGSAYTVDGVPALVNALVRGKAPDYGNEETLFTLQYLAGIAPFRMEPSKNGLMGFVDSLLRFSVSHRFSRPKIVFHATARDFRLGDTIPVFLSTTEDIATAGHYLAGAGRRVVTFLLQGIPQRPAPGGILKQWNARRNSWQWNEIVIPPHVYRVAKVEARSFGPLVTLEVVAPDLESELQGTLRNRVAPSIPEGFTFSPM